MYQDDLGTSWKDQCFHKCHACVKAGDCAAKGITGCDGYQEGIDGPASAALCLSETECRERCTTTADCVGIDMWKELTRCELNKYTGLVDDCDDQIKGVGMGLGSHQSINYLHRDGSYGRQLTGDTGLSSGDMLRFSPIDFKQGGSFKVCFCDHKLLPAGQEHCLAEKDYSIEIGPVYASGVSCLLAEDRFRRGTCYDQFHGGLACSPTLTRTSADEGATKAGLPSAFASLVPPA